MCAWTAANAVACIQLCCSNSFIVSQSIAVIVFDEHINKQTSKVAQHSSSKITTLTLSDAKFSQIAKITSRPSTV